MQVNYVIIFYALHSCIAQCNKGYQFPKGATQLLVECYEGTWQIDGEQTNFVPDCEGMKFDYQNKFYQTLYEFPILKLKIKIKEKKNYIGK